MDFKLRQNPSGLEMVNEFMKRMKSTTEEAKSTICKAQENMTLLRRLSYDGKYQLNNIVFFLFYIIINFSLLNSCCLLL